MTTTASARLRAGTRDRHDALERTGFATALLDGTLPLARYTAQLAALRLVLGELESELSRAAAPSVAGLWAAEDLRKAPLIERDLRHFASHGTAPGRWPAAHAAAFTADIRTTAVADPLSLLGFLYVLEGSTLGALHLCRCVSRAYGLHGTDGMAYYASGDRARWIRFTTRLDEALADPPGQDRALAAALRAYRHTARITGALSSGLTPAGGPAQQGGAVLVGRSTGSRPTEWT
ncbi:biliverdin-producing heme oxygenase [Streptomyces sp. NPDC059680]|uniref:biliverdin-producing heme oxygenase n=1 Tax=Streptomyces sp. NPDC059680 TaxID=3346904 RepID=UPI0036BD73FD